MVDYAHTPDALVRALETLRPLTRGKLVVVFGCGGDRDAGKRPQMGEAASRLADVAVLTSDNPRTENPEKILADVATGMAPGYHLIADRRQAIYDAVGLCADGDTLLVAGKGHEDYQILGTEKVHFDDREELTAALMPTC